MGLRTVPGNHNQTSQAGITLNRSTNSGGRNTQATSRSHSGRRNARREEPLTLDKAVEQALAEALTFEKPSDRVLSEFFRRHKGLGRRDRGMIANRVFDAVRQRRLYAHLAESGTGPLARRIALIADQAQSQTLMRPDADEQAWLARVATIDRKTLGLAVRLSLPDWLIESLQGQSIPGGLEALAQGLLQPAALDVRANLLKTDAASLRTTLAAEEVAGTAFVDGPLAESGTALRITGHPAFERLASFIGGQFEVQDAGSQWVAHRAGAKRGQAVVDFCAGAGGKTLAMAAMMRGSGQIYACDTSLIRLARLKPRLARSGATNVQPMHIESENDRKLRKIQGRADLVLVDAPCSGTGTLRRNPDLKWRQQPGDLARLAKLQLSILQSAVRLLKPGGRIIYVTCSLLEQENEAVALAFEAADEFAELGMERFDLSQPGIKPVLMTVSPDLAVTDENNQTMADIDKEKPIQAGFVRLWPHLTASDGFFVAGWHRKPS